MNNMNLESNHVSCRHILYIINWPMIYSMYMNNMNLEGNPVSWRHNREVDGGCGKHEAISGLEIYLAFILAYIF